MTKVMLVAEFSSSAGAAAALTALVKEKWGHQNIAIQVFSQPTLAKPEQTQVCIECSPEAVGRVKDLLDKFEKIAQTNLSLK